MLRHILIASLCALSAACASTSAVPRPFPAPRGSGSAGRPPSPGAPAVASGAPAGPLTPEQLLGYRIAATALEFRGVPYRNGGVDPTGFDCSGLVAFVFRQYGRAVPRHTSAQFAVGAPVAPERSARAIWCSSRRSRLGPRMWASPSTTTSSCTRRAAREWSASSG